MSIGGGQCEARDSLYTLSLIAELLCALSHWLHQVPWLPCISEVLC